MYGFRNDIRPSHRFLPTVSEFVRLVQVGLSMFDLFPMDPEQQNGLLCDITVEGLKSWSIDIGESYMKIEVGFPNHQ